MAIRHRLMQVRRALTASSRPIAYALAERYLSVEQMTLFRQMSHSEQLHSINVLRDVLNQGETPPDLARAALLHDVGKSRCALAIWQKSLAVIMRKLLPAQYASCGQDTPENLTSRWRRACVVANHHPRWGADLLESTGTSDCTIWLVRHHADRLDQWQGHPNQPLLARLRSADDEN